jgi:hypothetical protein
MSNRGICYYGMLMAWVLWTQPHAVVVWQDRVVVQPDGTGVWKYADAFDTKTVCHDARKQRLAEQDTALAALTPTSPNLATFTYKDFSCYPESIDPTNLTRSPLEFAGER